MESKQFANGYPRILSNAEIHRGNFSADIADASNWSYRFGELLHSRLRDEQKSDPAHLAEYRDWSRDEFPNLQKKMAALAVKESLEARVRTNFHYLNRYMTALWPAVLNDERPSQKDRERRLNTAQIHIATEGLKYYMLRQDMIDQEGTHVLFDEENEAFYRSHKGVLQEFDAAVVLIDVMRHNPHLSILPAPIQFESTNARRNVDFVVVDTLDDRAVGVQVKSRLRQEDYDKVDQKRVVFIDGDTDLGNIRSVRTKKGRSLERVVAWPGIISAHKVTTTKTHGRHQQVIGDPRRLLPYKFRAKELLRKTRVNTQDIAAKIGERILQRL